jgi:hypothetical protein
VLLYPKSKERPESILHSFLVAASVTGHHTTKLRVDVTIKPALDVLAPA